MNKKKKYIQYPVERAILSDVLPYEVPITFSNRYLYRFIIDNGISIDGEKIIYNNKFIDEESETFQELLRILFHHKFEGNDEYKYRKIPFSYRITHKENDFRELALIHPINQLKLIRIYDEFKESILYSCSVSVFSLRKPVSIAKYTYFNDKLHHLNIGDKHDFLELHGKEYENLKTFFAYKKYTNIYRFYEDYRYQRAEKKFNSLYTFDISKCFDSIYTHSISWAVLGLDAVKENVEASKKNFSGIFDKFIQYANYGETNGIIIGPEFSRIFAEIILQKIDKTVEEKLKKLEYHHKTDYELYRYVDDYFLFCDDEKLKQEILKIYKHELKEYKLSINSSKSKEYHRPIITEITIAKEKINKLFSENPRFSIKEIENSEIDSVESDDDIKLLKHKFSFYFSSEKLITAYKILIKESKIDYKDVLNYSLAILNNIVEKNLLKLEKTYFPYVYNVKLKEINDQKMIKKILQIENQFIDHLVSYVDFVFFIYSVSPRVNSTIKTCHVLSKILLFLKLKDKTDKHYLIGVTNRNKVYKKILDESSLIIRKNTITEYAQIETMYLLTVLKELGKDFRIPEATLGKFLQWDDSNNKIPDNKLNYFSIVVLLFYIGHSAKYPKVKEGLLNYINNYIISFPFEKRSKSSEMTHLILDLLACPFIEHSFKVNLLVEYKNDSSTEYQSEAEKLVYFHKNHIKYWFTKWERFNLAKELDYKKSQEVYS